MAIDPNDLISALRSNPSVRLELARLMLSEVLPAGAIVGAATNAPLKGFRAVSAPTYYYQKEG